MSVTFRDATTGDTETLVAMMRQLYEYDHTYFDEANCRRVLPLILTNENFGRVWVIESDDTAVGYLVLTFGFSLEYHGRDAIIDEIFITEPYRKHGIGKQAISLAVETCKSLGIDAVHLVVEHENLNAQAVYENVGFERHTRYFMTKWVDNSPAE